MLGGTNNYQYALNPISWIDPFGLSSKEPPEICPKNTIPDNYDPLTDTFSSPDEQPDPIVMRPDNPLYGKKPEDEVTIYRGVHGAHPDLPNARLGKAVPKGGHSNPVLHNAWDNESVFTSWTTDEGIAREFASGVNQGKSHPGGIVLKDTVKVKDLQVSPDDFMEKEVLRRGEVHGAEIIKLDDE